MKNLSLDTCRPMSTQLLSTWWFGINSSSPPCSPAFIAQHDVVHFGMSLVTVAELSWLCLHLQTIHPASGGAHKKQKSWRLGRAVQYKLKNRGSFCQCCSGHKSRTQHWMGCSEQTPPEPSPIQTSAHPDVDTNPSSLKSPHLNALPYTSPVFFSPGLNMEFIILKSGLRCPLTTLVNKPFNWYYRERLSKTWPCF